MANEQQRESDTERLIEADIALTIVPAIIAAVDAQYPSSTWSTKGWPQGRRGPGARRQTTLDGTARSRRQQWIRVGEARFALEARGRQQLHGFAVLIAALTCASLSEMTWVIGRSQETAGPPVGFFTTRPSRSYERKEISALVIVTSKGSNVGDVKQSRRIASIT